MEYQYKLDYTFIAKQVKKAREAAHLTQAQLAERIEISINAVARLETDRMRPKLQTLLRIANVFQLDINYFLCDDAKDSGEKDETSRLLNGWLHELSTKEKVFLIHVIDGLKTYNNSP